MKEEFVYKYRILLGIISATLSILLFWYLWSALFASSGEAVLAGFTLQAMVTYLILSTCMRTYQTSYMEYQVQGDVRTGYIAIELTRPYKYPLLRLFHMIGETIYNIITRVLPILLIGFVFFNLNMPVNTFAFFISAILAFIINFSLVFMTGMWSFWTIGNIWGLKHSREALTLVFSGSIIPLSFFPGWLVNVANLLPFKAMYGTPLSIYIGNIIGIELYYAILHQVIWAAVLVTLTYFIWGRAEKKTVVQGG
jgi:ABC-2 type transport system permease protein